MVMVLPRGPKSVVGCSDHSNRSGYSFLSLAQLASFSSLKDFILRKSLATVAQDHVLTKGIRSRQTGW